MNAFVEFQLSFGEPLFDSFIAPGIYFLEILVISAIPIISLWRDEVSWSDRLWAGNGALMGLVVLGAWSIGGSLILSLALFVILGISISLRQKQSLLHIGGIALKFLVFQLIFMLLVILLAMAGIISD